MENAPTTERSVTKSMNKIQRRILGVLIEKARTTPDAYPLSLNALVNGANQKSNRHPLMQLTPETIEDELVTMRTAGMVAEVQGGSRVPKYRHYAYDYLGVKGAEAAVMTELLLRGEQTAGELRTRASRFEPIADLTTLHEILDSLKSRNLVVALTPAGRGQVFTHNLYLPEELEKLKRKFSEHTGDDLESTPAASQPARDFDAGIATGRSPTERQSASGGESFREEIGLLREEICELRLLVEELTDRLQRLEG